MPLTMHRTPAETHVALLHVQLSVCVFKGKLTHVGKPMASGSWELMDKHSLCLLHSGTTVNHFIRLLRWSPSYV